MTTNQDAQRVAVLAGASGLVGGYCLARLIASPRYRRIIVVTRRDLGPLVEDPKVTQAVVDFARLEDTAAAVEGDDVFCALGTTIKRAGSRQRFREVDYEYSLRLARVTYAAGARRLTLVSSLGANPASRTFYLKVKGELEQAILAVGFPDVTILRPSVIAGPRPEFRLAERLSRWVLAVAPPTWRPVHADTIAAGMVAAAEAGSTGVAFVESKDIASLTRRAVDVPA